MIEIKSMRSEKGLSGATTAELSGISYQHYNFIENGKRRPSVEVAKRIAAVLGFDWTRFFEDAPEDKREPPQIGAAGKVG